MIFLETARNSANPRRIAAVSPGRPMGFQPVSFVAAGAEIYAPGDKSDSLYRVEFGAVRIYRLLADGRRQISAFHLPGEIFGFEAGTTHQFFAEAVCATGIRARRSSSQHSEVAAGELLPLALQGLVRAQEHLLVLGRQNAAERVAAFLTEMSERQGGLERVELPMSRADIADYLGLTIETVSRVFSKLRQAGTIRLIGLRCVEIIRPHTLEAMAA